MDPAPRRSGRLLFYENYMGFKRDPEGRGYINFKR
jgi:hypothetical protein